jgi:putative pyruvate formate lyase activating enzyme
LAKDYPLAAMNAIREMYRQVGDLVMDERGIAQKGLIVRHLVLPEGLAGTGSVAKFLADEISPDTYYNIMEQYYPCYCSSEHPPLDRKISDKEYKEAVKAARKTGLTGIA